MVTFGPTRAWLVTFTDLSALLCAFFVLAYSMTSLQHQALEQVRLTSGPGPDLALSLGLVDEKGTDLSSAVAAGLEPRRVGYLVSVLDRDLAAAGRPCGLSLKLHHAYAELRFTPMPVGPGAEACTGVLTRTVQILVRLTAGRTDAVTLVLPQAADGAVGFGLARAAAVARDLEPILGFTPSVLVSLASSQEAVLRVGPF